MLIAVCVNTRDNLNKLDPKRAATCARLLRTEKKATCGNYLVWKDCDSSCNLCACSTAKGTKKEHCSGHGKCYASCTTNTCTGAKCICDDGYFGEKCEKGIFIIF